MKESRKKIQELDFILLELLAQRFRLAKEIGELKRTQSLQIKDEEREGELLEKIQEKARELQLSPEFVNELYELILKESKRIQSS